MKGRAGVYKKKRKRNGVEEGRSRRRGSELGGRREEKGTKRTGESACKRRMSTSSSGAGWVGGPGTSMRYLRYNGRVPEGARERVPIRRWSPSPVACFL